MITIQATITGGALAGQLADDPEETFYLLGELALCAPDDFAQEVAEIAGGRQTETIVPFLRNLADKIEAEG